jgi:competence protein ComEC
MRRLLAAAAAAVVVSAFATLATLPLVAFNFHLLPLSGIFVTVLSLPAQAAILAASGVTALAGLVHPALGEVSGWVAWFPLAYQTGMVALAPGPVVAAPWSGPASGVLTALWYGALAALLLRPSVPGGLGALAGRARSFIAGAVPEAGAGPRRRPAALLAVGLPLAVVGALLWARVLSGPDGRLHVYFFDVGQGDSILVVSPAGRQVLVDGGPGTQSAVRALAGPLAPWDRSLDLVVLTHPDADHAQGLLEVLERMDVGAVLQGVEDPASPVSPPWQSALGRRGIPALAVTEGHTVDLGEGLTLEVLNPPGQAFQGTGADRNNNGVVLRLVYGDASLMLMGDIEAPGEERLLRRPQELAADVLKVAHHGSRTSTTPEFLRAVNPSLAVVSVGASNRYGHPHPQVVERLQAQVGAGGLLRTDQQGTVEVISDGQGIWYRTQRGR